MKHILYIVWNEKNNFGIPIIDEQHRGIISTINSLYYFIQQGHGHEMIKPTLIMLDQYIDIHFKTEEALMAQARYPALEEHIGLHLKLTERTKKLSLNLQADGDPDILLNFLKEWWLHHINQEDRKYMPFINSV